ncbi:MAG: prolyl oligopeptidase family serine peptidase [Deinococcales bacterium]
MAYWTHTNEFKSAVTQRSISNWLSFYGTSDIGYRFTLLQQGGNPWEDTERLWQQSPLKYVANITTPLLILHSEADYRCPIEQAEQFYTALKQLDKAPCEFIRFPAESHELSRSGRPDRRVARL